MIINNREIILVQYSTERNWLNDMPKSNWACILIDNDRPREYIDEVLSKILNNNVCYLCTVGQSSEKTHDLMDEEIIFRQVDIDGFHLPKHPIVTTWHSNISEGIWFGIFAASHNEIDISKVVILDMTNGEESERIDKILDKLKTQD